MNLDRVAVLDPPEYDAHLEADDAPEQLGDDFELSLEQRAKIHRASQWGRSMILRARAGDPQALQDLQTRMHVTVYRVMR